MGSARRLRREIFVFGDNDRLRLQRMLPNCFIVRLQQPCFTHMLGFMAGCAKPQNYRGRQLCIDQKFHSSATDKTGWSICAAA